MLGRHDPQKSLFAYSIDLDRRVRSDHPLRALHRALGDLDWVRQAVAPCYGGNGHVSVDPVILVKMMILLFWDNVASERELMRVIPERLDYLWFLGYGLEQEVPDHSVLSKARSRWGAALFEELFVRSIELCVRAGLVDGAKLHIDSSLIRAHASRDSILQSSPELVQALQSMAGEQMGKLEVTAVNATHLSATDPGATLARSSPSQPAQLSYKHHRTVDDAHGVITAVATTTGRASDAAQLPALVPQHQQHTQTKVETVVGDSHYGTAENYRHCQCAGLATHLKVYGAHLEERGIMPISAFVYEAEQDRYRCPQGQYLYYHNHKKEEQTVAYLVDNPEACRCCPWRAGCTASPRGRMVKRPLFVELVLAGQEQARSAAAKKDLRRRKHLMEGSFADAANNHGFKRARWRGWWRQRIQNWLIAAMQNIRLWMRNIGQDGQAALAMAVAALGVVCLGSLLCRQMVVAEDSRLIPEYLAPKTFHPFTS
jgi:transposase